MKKQKKQKLKKSAALFLIAVCAFMLFACGYSNRYYEKSEVIFENSQISLDVMISGKNAKKASDEIFNLAAKIDGEISLTRNTAISRFNESSLTGGENKTEISFEVYELINLSIAAEEKTGGAFSIFVLPLAEMWHVTIEGVKQYNDTLKALSFDLPSADEINQTLSYCKKENLTLFEEDGKYYICKNDPRLKIDLGGIAKGYILDLIKGICLKYNITSGAINLSGDMLLIGNYQDFSSAKEYAWEVAILNPRPRLQYVSRGFAALTDISGDIFAVTSGDYMRYIEYSYGDKAMYFSHIINPLTGMPSAIEYSAEAGYKMSDSSLSSVTVFASSGVECEIFSTAATIKGIEDGGNFLKEQGVKGVLFSDFNNLESETPSADRLYTVGDITLKDSMQAYKAYKLTSI